MSKVLSKIFLVFLFLCSTLWAQEIGIKKQPGYVDLSKIEIPGNAGKVTEISLGPALLRLAAGISENSDKTLSKSLSGIFSIQVKSFEVDSKEAKKIRPIMAEIEKKLNRENWESLVRVKEEDELTIISIKHEKNKVVGLLVMSLKPGDEASFVNIVGNIDLKNIGKLGMGLNNSALDSLQKALEK